jgi:hypothetical protein
MLNKNQRRLVLLVGGEGKITSNCIYGDLTKDFYNKFAQFLDYEYIIF